MWNLMQFLIADQRQKHNNVCEELSQIFSSDTTVWSRVITGDKSWIYGHDLEAELQSCRWKR
jgi:hypothetical protein